MSADVAIEPPGLAPVSEARRIESIDVLRGLALLGILILNIQTFSMPWEAYTNPLAYGDISGGNYWTWYFSQLLCDMKFMAIFSMLFGAGVILMTERLEATGRSAIGVHYRRMIWLLLIGMLHAYGLWYGDILVPYALCGMIVIWCRKLRPVLLLVLGLVVVSVASLLTVAFGLFLTTKSPEQAQQMLTGGTSSFEIQVWEVMSYTGDWLKQFEHRAQYSLMVQTYGFFFFIFWRAAGLMLMGMALYKWGVFSATRSSRFYIGLVALGALVGLPLIAWGLHSGWEVEWDPIYSKFTRQYNYWGSILVALGWTGLVMLLVKWGLLRWLQHALASVGRMALSNYLLQTIVCTTIFYGHGFGAFGSVERTDQMLIVLGVSVAQLIWSPLWLAAFRFGPAEWIWRSLTYWRFQPMRRSRPGC